MKLLLPHEVQYIASRPDGGRHVCSSFDALTQKDLIWILYKHPGKFRVVAEPKKRNQIDSTYKVEKKIQNMRDASSAESL